MTINLTFKHGGACEFGQLVLRTASTASRPQFGLNIFGILVFTILGTFLQKKNFQNFHPCSKQQQTGQYPAPPPSYDYSNGIPQAGQTTGVLDPMTGFYVFPGQQPAPTAPPPHSDAPPSYNSLQEMVLIFVPFFFFSFFL